MRVFDFRNRLCYLFDLPRLKFFYLSGILTFALGLVLGVFFVDTLNITIFKASTENFIFIVFSNSSLSSIITSRLVTNLWISILCSMVLVTKFLIPLNYLILLYRGYLLGCIFVTITISYSIVGILLLLFLIIPIQFCYCFFFVSISTNCMMFSCKKSNCNSFWQIGLKVLLLILFEVLVSFIEISIIFIVIRPINTIL